MINSAVQGLLIVNPKTELEQSEITDDLQKVNEKTKNIHHRTILKITIIQTTRTHHLQLTNNMLMT